MIESRYPGYRSMCLRLGILLLTGVYALACHPLVARAQAEAAASSGPESDKAYVTQYTVTVLLIALGLAVVCMPSRRTDRVKGTDDDL
jgi:hypothetical protein